jgi:hypothetical protein
MKTYFGSATQNFENGVIMDLRVKMAVDFLKTGDFAGMHASDAANKALDLADALLDAADARGLLLPLPDDNSLNAPLRRQLERNCRMQAFQQNAMQRIAVEEAPRVMPGVPMAPPNGRAPR